MKEKANIKTKITVVGIIALTLLIIGIISAPNVLQKMGVQVGEKEGEEAGTAQVLVGKTFTSSLAGVGAAGAMADYTQNLQTAQIAANETGVSIVNIPAGYYEQIQVDASAVYEAGTQAGAAAATTGNAAEADVLSGKTFTSTAGVNVSGTMTNRGAVSESVGVGGTYTIPAGYHNGSGKVTGPSTSNKTITLTSSQTGSSTHTYNAAVGTVTVDASNVYNKGKSDATLGGTFTSLYTKSNSGSKTCSFSYTIPSGTKNVIVVQGSINDMNCSEPISTLSLPSGFTKIMDSTWTEGAGDGDLRALTRVYFKASASGTVSGNLSYRGGVIVGKIT